MLFNGSVKINNNTGRESLKYNKESYEIILNLINQLFDQYGICAIWINGYNNIQIENDDCLEKTESFFKNNIELENFIKYLHSKNNIQTSEFMFEGDMGNNLIYVAILPENFQNEPVLIIKRNKNIFFHNKVIQYQLEPFIDKLFDLKANIMITGEAKSGKTLFINYLLSKFPKREKCITIENTFSVNHIRSSFTNINITPFYTDQDFEISNDNVKQLINHFSKLNLSKLILDEGCGNEVIDFLKAIDIQYRGSIFSFKGANAQEAIDKIYTINKYSQDNLNKTAFNKLFANAVDIIIEIEFTDVSKINRIYQVALNEQKEINLLKLFEYNRDNNEYEIVNNLDIESKRAYKALGYDKIQDDIKNQENKKRDKLKALSEKIKSKRGSNNIRENFLSRFETSHRMNKLCSNQGEGIESGSLLENSKTDKNLKDNRFVSSEKDLKRDDELYIKADKLRKNKLSKLRDKKNNFEGVSGSLISPESKGNGFADGSLDRFRTENIDSRSLEGDKFNNISITQDSQLYDIEEESNEKNEVKEDKNKDIEKEQVFIGNVGDSNDTEVLINSDNKFKIKDGTIDLSIGNESELENIDRDENIEKNTEDNSIEASNQDNKEIVKSSYIERDDVDDSDLVSKGVVKRGSNVDQTEDEEEVLLEEDPNKKDNEDEIEGQEISLLSSEREEGIEPEDSEVNFNIIEREDEEENLSEGSEEEATGDVDEDEFNEEEFLKSDLDLENIELDLEDLDVSSDKKELESEEEIDEEEFNEEEVLKGEGSSQQLAEEEIESDFDYKEE